jgi:hypothetical protein
MSDKLVVWIGNWIAVEAEGFAALCTLVAIVFLVGGLVVLHSKAASFRQNSVE